MTRTSDHKNWQKKIGCSGIASSYFPALMYMAIFHNSEPRGRKTTTMLFMLKVLWYSNNLMQTMTSITSSIHEVIHFKVFFKNFVQNFSPISRFKPILNQTYSRLSHFGAIPSICYQRSLPRRVLKMPCKCAIFLFYLFF